MNLLLIVSGVVDYRRPLEKPACGDWLELLRSRSSPYRLSPFDESALEISLKLAMSESAHLTLVATDCSADRALLTTLLAYKPDELICLEIPPEIRGNPVYVSNYLRQELADRVSKSDLILTGRELGDLDDGVLPPYLANSWSLPFVPNALSITKTETGFSVDRAMLNRYERISIPGRALVSVINDRRNRLRHPLMKNLALAKRQSIPPCSRVSGEWQHDRGFELSFVAATPVASRRDLVEPCRLIEGDLDSKAVQVAKLLSDRYAR